MTDSQDHTSASSSPSAPSYSRVEFSQDLAEYIRTGVDPTGRYAQPTSKREQWSFSLFVCGLFLFFLVVGLLSGGVGRQLIEWIVPVFCGGGASQ